MTCKSCEELREAKEAVIYAVGDYASNHKDDRFGSRRRLLEAYSAYKEALAANRRKG